MGVMRYASCVTVQKLTLILWGVALLLLAACSGGGGEPLPTIAAAAGLPTETVTILPPTSDIAATQVAANATPLPTNTRPAPTPTPVDPVVNITDPDDDDVLTMGSTLTVRGLVQKDTEQAVWVTLVSRNGRLLVEAPAEPNEIGWEVTFPIPTQVSGAAYVQAGVRDADGALRDVYQIPVTLVPDTAEEDRFLMMTRPDEDEIAVSGFNVFFDGELLNAADNTLSLSLWLDDCQRRVARQNFVLGSSNRPFSWQGFVIAPRDEAGPACAVASFGEPGTAEWREAQVPITILPIDNRDAKGIRIGNPPPDSELVAGEEIFVNGTALNVAAGELLVSVLMENGRIVSQTPVTTDYWGYWETNILLPPDIEGRGQIIAETGEADTFADGIADIVVLPPPTPTPVP